MKRILTFSSCLALLLAAGLGARAQGQGFHHAFGSPDGLPRHGEFLAKALDLSATQQAAAQKLHEALAAKAKPLADQHRQQMDEIEKLLNGVNPDAAEIGERMIAAHATGQQLKALHDDFETKFSALLTPAQLEKFKNFQTMRRERGPFITGVPAPEP
ncbi:MAG TPA: periplasmic heavy metal sensor [Thermoanaerobaculia bacterium]|nr:periplasmic heavy metal sensor [Thermoanaerobaculia bacterium]